MADRLAELLRQRALLQEHLAWLDAEIAAVSTRNVAQAPKALPAPSPASSAPASVKVANQILSAATPPRPSPANPQSAFGTAPAVAAEVSPAADEILDQYRSSPDSLKTDVRKGCLLYFIGAFVLLGLAVVAMWSAFRSGDDDNAQRPAGTRVERRP